MTLQRPPPPPLVWAKNWAERLNDYLTKVRTRLPVKETSHSAKEEGLFLYDRELQAPVYSKNGQFVTIGTSDLSSYATTASLSAYATTSSLSSYATTSYVQTNFISGTDFSTNIKKFVSTTGTDAVATYKASQHEFTHGLVDGAGNSAVPDLVEVELVCTQAELNFSVGDVIVATGSHAHASESQNNERGISVIKDSTKIYVNIAEDGIGLVVRPDETPRQINFVGGAGQKLILGVFNANAHSEGNAMPERSRFRIAGFQDSAINGDYELSNNNPSYDSSLQGGYWKWEFTPTTTWSTSAEASSGSRTVQVIGDSAKIGDNDTNASNSHWDVRVRALLLNI